VIVKRTADDGSCEWARGLRRVTVRGPTRALCTTGPVAGTLRGGAVRNGGHGPLLSTCFGSGRRTSPRARLRRRWRARQPHARRWAGGAGRRPGLSRDDPPGRGAARPGGVSPTGQCCWSATRPQSRPDVSFDALFMAFTSSCSTRPRFRSRSPNVGACFGRGVASRSFPSSARLRSVVRRASTSGSTTVSRRRSTAARSIRARARGSRLRAGAVQNDSALGFRAEAVVAVRPSQSGSSAGAESGPLAGPRRTRRPNDAPR